MIRSILTGAALTLLATVASAETIQVKMLGASPNEAMRFEPAFVQAQPGDTIEFIETSHGHNVATIRGMLPAGAIAVKSPIGESYAMTVTEEGLYGVTSSARYTVGMVALIQVGDAVNLEDAVAAPQKGLARAAMADLLTQVPHSGS
ncbi:pseudoazurin [Maritimibacter sp. DP1N21-5]|uniref:pseudoazurin n=1 Tax=Maritimibacter sp. DP1N21-5 TaxID=2836867 RepID=UPI001C46440F|nr:pseudoazurin [Maritimibacter sp. DP1N21-5]MBV7407828.1 pseudoazurin [Maritimibacter sp. DP1N21-5]